MFRKYATPLYMRFGKLNAQVGMTITGIHIDRVRVAKYIGVLIYEKLNGKDHIANVTSKLFKGTAIVLSVAK